MDCRNLGEGSISVKQYGFAALGLAVLTTGLIAFGCGAGQKQTETAVPQSKTQTAQTAPAAQASQTYPLDWCIVSGEKLGEMGAPVTYNYQGRTIKFCCKSCVKDFEREPARYLARLDSAVAGQIKPPHAEEGHGG